MAYYIRQEKSRQFILEHEGELISTLKFPKWSSSNAELTSANGRLKFSKKSIWKSSFIISKNEQIFGKITSNWKGRLFIQLFHQPDLVPSNMEMEEDLAQLDATTYHIKTKGILKQRHELYQEKAPRPLITLRSKSKWFKVNYEIELHHDDLISFELEDVLGIMNFCAYLIRMRQAAAGAA